MIQGQLSSVLYVELGSYQKLWDPQEPHEDCSGSSNERLPALPKPHKLLLLPCRASVLVYLTALTSIHMGGKPTLILLGAGARLTRARIQLQPQPCSSSTSAQPVTLLTGPSSLGRCTQAPSLFSFSHFS